MTEKDLQFWADVVLRLARSGKYTAAEAITWADQALKAYRSMTPFAQPEGGIVHPDGSIGGRC